MTAALLLLLPPSSSRSRSFRSLMLYCVRIPGKEMLLYQMYVHTARAVVISYPPSDVNTYHQPPHMFQQSPIDNRQLSTSLLHMYSVEIPGFQSPHIHLSQAGCTEHAQALIATLPIVHHPSSPPTVHPRSALVQTPSSAVVPRCGDAMRFMPPALAACGGARMCNGAAK